MFEKLFKAKPVVLDEVQPKQKFCNHQGRFAIFGHNTAAPPCGTCLDCGAEVKLDTIINLYLKKMDAILDAHGVK